MTIKLIRLNRLLAIAISVWLFVTSDCRKVAYSKTGFSLNQKPVILRGGAFQWFKMSPEMWENRMKQFKAMGFNTLDLYLSWRFHEPEPGKFDFKTWDLRRILRLAQNLELYVYLRPGPYITNEMDGGGIPAWVMAMTDKRVLDPDKPDGKVNLRTNDFDWIALTKRYYNAVNKVLVDNRLLYTQGGPVVLYGIENEYNWFPIFFNVDKHSQLPDGPERPASQKNDEAAYIRSLRDIVESSGVDIPITTCPGADTIAGTGNVPRVLPLPNIYNVIPNMELSTIRLLRDMHNPKKYAGVYTDVPAGTTETEKDVTTFRRLLISGRDAIFAFNVMNVQAEGYQNSMIFNGASVRSMYDVANVLSMVTDFRNFDRLNRGYIRPQIGLFFNHFDTGGSVLSNGLRRERFYEFRRTNLFVNAFEEIIAPAGVAKRSAMTSIEGLDKRVLIKDSRVGIADPDSKSSKVTYFLDLGNNRLLIGLLNQNNKVLQMPRNSIQALSYTFPKYTTLTVPLQHIIPGVKSSVFTTSEVYDTHYLSFLPVNFEFDREGQVRIDFSTAEILTRKIVNDEHLLILYGMLGAEGEIQLSSNLMFYEFKILGLKQQAIFNQNERYSTVYSFSFANVPQFLTFKCGLQKYRIVVLDMYTAGRVWFHRIDNNDVLVLGPDFLDSQSSHELTLEFSKDMTVYTLSDQPLHLFSRSAVLRSSRAFESESRLSMYKYRHQKTNELIPSSLLSHGQVLFDSSILMLNYDFLANGFKPLNAINPTPLEMNQIYYGNAFYTAQFDLDSAEYQSYYEDVNAKRLPRIGGLYIEHASDIVGIYINGYYVTTVVPIGTEIDSNGSSDYQFVIPPEFLKVGINRILFRAEVWGHGSFMWHRGNIGKIFKLNIPALGVDSVKGIHGKATFAKKTLKNWLVRQWSDGQLMQAWGLGAEAQGRKQMEWKNGKLPLKLDKGAMMWYKVIVQKKEVFPNENEVKNVVIHLKGENAKATIYVNGRIIGRWLSDNQCLTRGSWIQPLRNIWTEAPADEIPLQPEWFNQKDNVIAFYFEDMGNQAIQYQIKNVEMDKVQARHKVASGVIERLEVIVKQDRAVRKVKASIRLQEN